LPIESFAPSPKSCLDKSAVQTKKGLSDKAMKIEPKLDGLTEHS
jgi:hypothetical protein